ncbi:M64 family metallopeptidase [bacterium]|nr:M64 family metallopeptidase [bacterium]
MSGIKNVRILIVFACFALIVPARSLAGSEQTKYWQLTIHYENSAFQIIDAAEIQPMLKKVVTPGVRGAVWRVQYQASWLDSDGKPLIDTATEFPLGDRVVMPAGTGENFTIPAESTFVVRLKGPDAKLSPKSLRLRRTGITGPSTQSVSVPPAFESAGQTLAIPAPAPKPKTAGPIQCLKIRDTGPDSNRLVIVVMGDGYTAANLAAGAFTTAANDLVTGIAGRAPWDTLVNCTNIYRIDVESNQEGADRTISSTEPIVDTYFNSSYWTSGIQRLLAIDSTGRSRAIAAANAYVGTGMWDLIFINVNSTVYGGSGGSIMVYSNHSSHTDLVWHETGHTFAGLADEYTDAYPGYPAGDSEPNVDYDYSGAGLKWLAWVEAGTPLPTPATSQYASVVGAFEGARYLTTGIYRPYLWCEMRALGFQFCPVCKEAHIDEMLSRVQRADSQSPATGPTYILSPTGTPFSFTPLPLSGLNYQWYIDSTPISGETGTALTRCRSGSGTRQYTLSARIGYASPLVRKDLGTSSVSWNCIDYGLLDEVWLNFAFSGIEIGTQAQPFNTMAEGLACQSATGHIKAVGPNATAETLRITKPTRIEAIGGTVRIGAP